METGTARRRVSRAERTAALTPKASVCGKEVYGRGFRKGRVAKAGELETQTGEGRQGLVSHRSILIEIQLKATSGF